MKIQSVYLALAVVLLSTSAHSLQGQPDTHILKAQTDVPGGAVGGVWTAAASPYRINGEITIPNDSTLTIEPGVEVVFMGHFKFNVQGRLLAVGTREDTIRFTAENTETGWHGIRFLNTPKTNDTSKIVYCVLRNGKANTGSGFDRCGGAMLIAYFDKVEVSHCLFDSNMQSAQNLDLGPLPEAGPAIYIYHASPTISQSTFSHHTGSFGGAVACLASPKAIVSHNLFTKNEGGGGPLAIREPGSPIISGNIIYDNVGRYAAGGIAVETGASPTIENNIVIHNSAPYGGGILCWQGGNAVFLNNTIADNVGGEGGGIFCHENSDPILINNILYGNTATYRGSQVCLYDDASDPDFLFCNIQGGKEGFAGAGGGGNYFGLYQDNIDNGPMFAGAASGDYRISDSSPCIGAGIDSIQRKGKWYRAPLFDFGGNPRPNPYGTYPDIGAWEHHWGFSVAGQAYAHHVRLSRSGRDTIVITVRVENPLGHVVNVTGILTSGSGVLIDSLLLKDDGLHGDGSSSDGLWGHGYVPKKDDTIRVTLRTDDITAGTSRTLPNASQILFTRGAVVALDPSTIDLGMIGNTLQHRDTTFTVRNIGFAADSLTLLLDPVNVIPETAVSVSPTSFFLAPGDSQKVTFRIQAKQLIPQYYQALVTVQPKSGLSYGSLSISFAFQIIIVGAVTTHGEIPKEFALDQNYPNPFNPRTVVSFQLPVASQVRLVVFDLLGREVAVLVDENKPAGVYEVQFDASGLASGVYLYRLRAGSYVETRKMALVR